MILMQPLYNVFPYSLLVTPVDFQKQEMVVGQKFRAGAAANCCAPL